MNIQKKTILHYFFTFAVYILPIFFGRAQTNGNCSGIQPMCADGGYTYYTNGGTFLESGNDYGCLTTLSNPAWFFLESATIGTIDLTFTAALNIDVIIYGPFSDISEITYQCGEMGSIQNPIVECASSPSSIETVSFNISGSYYVVLVTTTAVSPQSFSVSKTAGTGSFNCDVMNAPQCVPEIGTYVIKRNGVVKSSPLSIFLNDTLDITSNGDYVLPGNTISAPVGDGIYSAQILWLLYNIAPITYDPTVDPGFQIVFPGPHYSDTNNALSYIIQNYGCGSTIWLVPFTGDDGVGGNGNVANGINDNGNLHWDKNNDDCYEMGDIIQITYECVLNTEKIKLSENKMYFAQGFLYRNNGEETMFIDAFDLCGRLISSFYFPSGVTEIPIALEPGYYIFCSLSEKELNSNFTTKIVIPVSN